MKRIRAQACVSAAERTLIFGALVLVLWSGAHDVIGGRMSAGTLGQFVLYALIGGGSVGALAEVWNDLQRHKTAAKPIAKAAGAAAATGAIAAAANSATDKPVDRDPFPDIDARLIGVYMRRLISPVALIRQGSVDV